MTKQEMFDKAYLGVLGAGLLCRSPATGANRYRLGKNAGNENRCAIGHLIPNAFYRPGFEGKPVEKLPKRVLDYLGDLGLACEIQLLHDSNATLEGFDLGMRELAANEKLRLPE